MNDFWIILTGALVAVSCGMLGVYLILRKMAMVGDAISHAVLPGIVIGFMLSGSLDSPLILLGAALFGLITTLLIDFFRRKVRLHTDASIGFVFTVLFAIGIIMISGMEGNVHLDQDCVLYGEIAFVWMDKGIWGIPVDTLTLSGILVAVILFIVFGYKELMITAFDPAFAASAGLSVMGWHYGLMGMVSLASVGSFESVGAILVVAFLIVPGASAYLLTDSLRKMLILSALFGVLSATGGYFLADWANSSISGAMTVCAGILFAISFIFSPRYGLFKKKNEVKTDELQAA